MFHGIYTSREGHVVFEGIANLISFLKLCKELDLLVMMFPGPYICGEWDFGGFPAWLLAKEPAIKLRSSDPAFLELVEKWWGILLPTVSPLLYSNGGPITMVQIENEFCSYGNDQAYLQYLVKLARTHLGEDIILYTTDGGSRQTLEKGTIRGDTVFSDYKNPYTTVNFTTGDDPWPIFKLQKEYNGPGKSPPLSAEFYTGWLTHWGENIASTDATFTANNLEKILSKNGWCMVERTMDFIVVLILEIASQTTSLILHPMIVMHLLENLVMWTTQSTKMFGFVLYASEYTPKGNGSVLSIPKVHDRAEVFISCSEDGGKRPTYVDVITRQSNRPIYLPCIKCALKNELFILVENMGRLNYGPYIFDRKGILSCVYLDSVPLHKWKMHPISLESANEALKINRISLNAKKKLNFKPAFYTGHFNISKVGDTYISLRGWSKGIAFVNDVNIGRYWPSVGPQCNVYVPAPILREGGNTVVILELEKPNPKVSVSFVDYPDFTCGKRSGNRVMAF